MTESTSKNHFEAPRGMRDFYPAEMEVRNAIFDAWNQAAALFGFAQYDACLVESLELVKRKSGEEIIDQVYAFTDKNKRELALRPEMTPTLARMIASRQKQLVFPLKWYAIAQCFRYERMSLGRKREHYQWNLDIVGEQSLAAEAEILACAIRALTILGFDQQDVRVHLNSRALLTDLLLKAGVKPRFHAATFRALDKRGKIADAQVDELLSAAGLDQAGIKAVFRLLDIKSINEAESLLEGCMPSLQAVKSLLGLLESYGVQEMVEFDISVVRGLGYYTGIVFEAFDSEKRFRSIFGGGRYDRLMENVGGDPMPAVGLGFGDVVIGEFLKASGKAGKGAEKIDYAIGYLEQDQSAVAISAARTLRESGKSVDLALRSEKAKHFFSRVGKGGIRRAIFIGPDDIRQGVFRVKDLKERTERSLPVTDLVR